MDYTPHTEADVQAMLAEIGISRVADLFAHLPEDVRLGRALDIAPGLSEPDLRARIGALASRNRAEVLSFVGAGAYAHYVPSAVDALASRSEFATAYTPYQPEVSQGTLQAIFEFQTITSILLGTELANASMYDGASAAAEAVLMALRLKSGRSRDARPARVLVARAVHPSVRETVATYLRSMDDVALVELGFDGAGRVRLDDVSDDGEGAQSDVACVVVGYPNFFGVVEQLPEIAAWAHARGALLVTVTLEPVALGLLTAPGAIGADICVGEGQGLGLAPAFGGPGVGLFGTRESFLRAMPGRVVGETVDADGRRGFCLTLSTREQHIRREKATSNICTNHSLCALAFTVCVSLLGPGGLRDLARLNARKLRYAVQQLGAAGLTERFTGPTFNECVLRGNEVGGRWDKLVRRGIVAGIPLGRWYPELEDSLLLCVTDVHRRGDVERLANEWRAAGA